MKEVSYSIYEVYNLQQGKQQKMLQARINSAGTIDTKSLCQLITERSSISSADVKATLDSLNFFFEYYLSQGYSIQLDDLGIFSLGLKSTRKPETDKDNALTVKINGIHFRPSVNLKNQIVKFKLKHKPKKKSSEYPQDERLKRILYHVEKHHYIDLKTCAPLNKTSPHKAKDDLHLLTQNGQLEAIGRTNNRVYIRNQRL